MKSTARKIKEKFFYPTPVLRQLVALVIQVKAFHCHGSIILAKQRFMTKKEWKR